MNLDTFLEHLNKGLTVDGGSEAHEFMHKVSQEALRITSALNNTYHSPEEIRELFSELTGKPVDCGKNITVGKNVFINSGCRFQDQGGITIGDGALIGHNAVLATLNHDFSPEKRSSMHPAPVVIGKNVWLGANVTVVPGVTIGDNAVIAAGAVVTKDIPAGTIAAGVPAKVLRELSV